MPKPAKEIRPRFRVMRGKEIALGPGKVDLLKKIAATGSIAEAAREMDMSYMRAWNLLKTMEKCFKKPLVEVSRGGKERGGTLLSDTGKEILALYNQMEHDGLRAVKVHWERLQTFLRD